MTYEAALKIIEETSLEKLREIPLENLATLTNDFYHEDAVRAIIAKGTTLEEQRDAFNMLNMAYESCYEQGWDKPDYFDDIQVCFNLGRMIPPTIAASTANPPIKEIVYNISTKKPAKTQETAQLQSRIKELQARLKQLTAENEQLKAQLEKGTTIPQKGEYDRLKERHEETLAELLAPAFYNDAAEAKRFLRKIESLDNVGVADVAVQFLKDRKIMPSKSKRDIWKYRRRGDFPWIAHTAPPTA